MDEDRCKMVATEMEDSRCSNPLSGGLNRLEDPRYYGLRDRMTIDVEDCRCNSVGIQMEDPRCAGLQSKW